MLKAFVDGLKRAREEAGITLERVAAKTRIDIKFLEAIERGDIDFLPEPYVKAFIKQYAKVLGLDEEETLQDFLIAKEGKQIPSNEEKAAESEKSEGLSDIIGGEKEEKDKDEDTPKTLSYTDESALKKEIADDKKKYNPALVGGGIVIGLLVIMLFYVLVIDKSDEIIVQEKPFEEVLEQTNQRQIEETNNIITEENLSTSSKELSLTLTNTDSNDSAWVLIVTDDVSKQDFILLPRASKTVEAKNNFQFTLGNSGVIKLVLNDDELEFKGRRGAIRYFKLDKDGLERIYSPPKLSTN
ncbi:MAG: helix-turn-helix domain-containing protein [Ignavibacterium sp.]|nr:MAG: helix-turn-helix domain-containing protein [Ignavibacterium sp.]